MLRAVDYWDPNQEHSYVKFLPLGLCLKTGPRVTANEGQALLLVEKHTSITAPRLVDVATEKNGKGYLLMTTVPGVPAERVFYRMTYEERENLWQDVGQSISQYRRIPNKSEHLICNTLGGPITDHRINDIPLGPYNSKMDFLNYLTEGIEELTKKRPLSTLYEKEHDVIFTHSDLHLSNLLVRSGRLSGIIDWENAGFRPEYWEYTRTIWAYDHKKRHVQEVALAFEKDYEEELEAESLLWKLKYVI